jgi:hypothetical protein
MTCQSVLRIGPTDDNVSATVLRNALIDFFSKKQQQQKQPGSDSATGGNDMGTADMDDNNMMTDYRFQVSNRYFTADILLKNVNELYSSTASSASSSSIKNDAKNENDNNNNKRGSSLALKEDGIILVFDAARSNPDLPMSMAASFDSLDSVHDRAVAMNSNSSDKNDDSSGGAGDLLRLCVGVSIGVLHESELRGKNAEQEYSRRILWCLDRGYEYVEADLSVAGMAKGHDVRDKDGFARIVEAISGTVWSSAVMAATKKKQLQQTYTADKKKALLLDNNDSDHGNNTVGEEEEEEEENLYVPPDPSLLTTSLVSKESDAAREEMARQALLEQSDIKEPVEGDEGYLLPAAADDETATFPGTNVDAAKLRQQRLEEQEQEQNFARLEGALRQATSLRDMAMSGTMSDEDRRKRAGDAAVMLMSLMGMDDDDADDDGEESVDNEQRQQQGDHRGDQNVTTIITRK